MNWPQGFYDFQSASDLPSYSVSTFSTLDGALSYSDPSPFDQKCAIEREACSNFTCCGQLHSNLHDLIEHFEVVHVMVQADGRLMGPSKSSQVGRPDAVDGPPPFPQPDPPAPYLFSQQFSSSPRLSSVASYLSGASQSYVPPFSTSPQSSPYDYASIYTPLANTSPGFHDPRPIYASQWSSCVEFDSSPESSAPSSPIASSLCLSSPTTLTSMQSELCDREVLSDTSAEECEETKASAMIGDTTIFPAKTPLIQLQNPSLNVPGSCETLVAQNRRKRRLRRNPNGTRQGRHTREKTYKCLTIGCSKSYLNPNGLKYHQEKGTCTNDNLPMYLDAV